MKAPLLPIRTLPMAILLLAGLALARSAAAAGPPHTCIANVGVPPVVNVERITALAADVVVICTGGTPTPASAPVPVADFQIFTNTNVTTRFTGTNLSDAVLLIDEPFPAAPVPDTASPQSGSGTQLVGVLPLASPVLGTGTGVGTFSGAPGRPNVFQGVVASANSVKWLGVPVDPPGPSATRTYRIRNLWVNASLLGISSTPIPTQVVLFVNALPNLQINNPQQTVAFIMSGMTSSVIAPGTFPANVTQNPGLVGNPSGTGTAQLTVRLRELFSTVFQRRNYALPPDPNTSPAPVSQNVPGFVYLTETGFFDQALLGGVGLADFGSRLRLDFENVSAGVSLFLPTVVPLTGGAASTTLPYPGASAPTGTGAGAMLRLISSDTGPFAPVAGTATLTPGGAAAQLAVVGGTATAIYEVLNSDAAAVETADIPVAVAFAAGSPQIGTTTVTAHFAPISAVTTSSSSAPVPRFVDFSTPLTAFGVVMGATPTPTPTAGPSTPIPTLSAGMLAAMGLLLFASGWLLLRR